jgi:hypothetical protein
MASPLPAGTPAGTSTRVVRAPAPAIAMLCVIFSAPLVRLWALPGTMMTSGGLGVAGSAFS